MSAYADKYKNKSIAINLDSSNNMKHSIRKWVS